MPPAYLKGPAGPLSGARVPGCEGKIAFTSAGLAVAAAKRKEARKHYRCTTCGLWHVGTLCGDEPLKKYIGRHLVRPEIMKEGVK